MDQSLPQLPVFGSSPPVPTYKGPTNRRKISRPSSQSSRVDVNGSPIANIAARDDHIRKLKVRLAEDIQARKRSENVAITTEVVAEDVQVQNQSKDNVEAVVETLPVEAPAQPHTRRPSEIFGPRIRLENKPKARPSSPETAATQYLPHKKTGKDQYEAVDTKEVVALDKPLADPFANNTRKPTDFTQRLRAGVSNGQQRKSLRFSQEDTEKTLVDVENLENHKRYSHSDPSDMTTGTSVESGSSEPSRSPLKERRNEMWNMAIRPHYKSLHDVVHRIADVSVFEWPLGVWLTF
jgi:predicted house-cleaning noncanonical NTP pyrophosphatase (MazG superfamily)